MSIGATWNIKVHDFVQVEAGNLASIDDVEEPVLAIPIEQMSAVLPYTYGHMEATTMASKQTATQRKGRIKDQEVAEEAKEPPVIHRAWRKPSFRESAKEGRTVGNATHAVLQYIRYAACTDEKAVMEEISRLVAEHYITAEQSQLVDCGKIARFFESELGKKLQTSEHVLREFKFSILDDAEKYAPGLAGEQVLLQGVVDCALVEEDGITILDFKTDRVSEDTVADTAQGYRAQVETYADALSRIFALPIKAKILYFFQLNRFWKLL